MSIHSCCSNVHANPRTSSKSHSTSKLQAFLTNNHTSKSCKLVHSLLRCAVSASLCILCFVVHSLLHHAFPLSGISSFELAGAGHGDYLHSSTTSELSTVSCSGTASHPKIADRNSAVRNPYLSGKYEASTEGR